MGMGHLGHPHRGRGAWTLVLSVVLPEVGANDIHLRGADKAREAREHRWVPSGPTPSSRPLLGCRTGHAPWEVRGGARVRPLRPALECVLVTTGQLQEGWPPSPSVQQGHRSLVLREAGCGDASTRLSRMDHAPAEGHAT